MSVETEEIRTCKKCGHTGPKETHFYKHGTGYGHICLQCKNAARRAYRAKVKVRGKPMPVTQFETVLRR